MSQDKVVALRLKDQVCQDVKPIATICHNLGPVTAQKVVTRALGEISQTVAALADQVKAHDLAEMRRPLRRLQRMSESLGLVTLGLIAVDLTLCIDSQDVTAFAAVWARLLRVADMALVQGHNPLGLTQG